MPAAAGYAAIFPMFAGMITLGLKELDKADGTSKPAVIHRNRNDVCAFWRVYLPSADDRYDNEQWIGHWHAAINFYWKH